MKTIKVIDLLNKIANGEEVPKEIKANDNIYHYDETDCNEFYRYRTMANELLTDYADLNDEAEILEEEKKIPEIIHWHEENGVGNDDDAFYVDVNDKSQYVDSEYDSWEMAVILKINEIIDYLESKEKGE